MKLAYVSLIHANVPQSNVTNDVINCTLCVVIPAVVTQLHKYVSNVDTSATLQCGFKQL